MTTLQDYKVGDPVTCREGIKVYQSDRTFTPGMIGHIAEIEPDRPAQIIVDFYRKNWTGPNHHHQTFYRCCLRLSNILPVGMERAKQYLWLHAPTWEERLTELLRWYDTDRFEAISQGIIQPYPMYDAHRILVAKLWECPTQQQFLEFLDRFAIEHASTTDALRREVEMVQITNDVYESVYLPWTYRVAGATLAI